MMTKKTKALAAAGAGAAVLLASGATFALWNTTTDIEDAGITTGNLTIEVSEVTWEDISDVVVFPRGSSTLVARADLPEGTVLNWNPSEDLLVPGDTVTASVEVTPGIEGTNLVAELTVGTAGVTSPLENVIVTPHTGAVLGDNVIDITIKFLSNNNDVETENTTPISLDGATVTLTQVREVTP